MSNRFLRSSFSLFALAMTLMIVPFCPRVTGAQDKLPIYGEVGFIRTDTEQEGGVIIAQDEFPLTSGQTVSGTIDAPPAGSGALVGTQFTIQVPAGATQLKVDLDGGSVDLDLFIRFGQRITIANGDAVSDYRSDSLSGQESITITPASTPPLQTGTYFIAIATFGPGEASFSLTATVSGGQQQGCNATTLTSGTPVTGTIAAPQAGGGVLGGTQFKITVPAGATQLAITVTANANVDLFVRIGECVAIQNNQIVATYAATSTANNETLTITSASTPPLAPGDYFIALGNLGPGEASFTLTATVTTGGGGGGGGNNLPVTTNFRADLSGDVLSLTGTVADPDGDIVQAQVVLLDAGGAIVGTGNPFNVNFGELTTVNFNLQISGLNAVPSAVRVRVIFIDSRGNRSVAQTADFSQADAGGPTITKVTFSGSKLVVKGKDLRGQVQLEINGLVVATKDITSNKKAKFNGTATGFNLRSGANRVRVRIGTLRSNIFVFVQ